MHRGALCMEGIGLGHRQECLCHRGTATPGGASRERRLAGKQNVETPDAALIAGPAFAGRPQGRRNILLAAQLRRIFARRAERYR